MQTPRRAGGRKWAGSLRSNRGGGSRAIARSRENPPYVIGCVFCVSPHLAFHQHRGAASPRSPRRVPAGAVRAFLLARETISAIRASLILELSESTSTQLNET